MGTLKEIEGRYLKKCNVIPIETNDDNVIIVRNLYLEQAKKDGKKYYELVNYLKQKDNWTNQELRDCGYLPVHLHITSDDEIKEGDWYLSQTYPSSRTNKYLNQKPCQFKESERKLLEQYKDITFKIIATTDKSLRIGREHDDTVPYLKMRNVYLPQLSQSFLKEFVANPDDKWEIEYDKYQDFNIGGINNLAYKYKLKLNQDNTVNITSVEKKMYSKEEVETILFQYAEEEHAWFSCKSEIESFNNWIKENL